MRVLLVEDQADLARQVKRALERADHQVSIASDGPSAVLAATERHFDLIVLDVNLPGFDGFEALRQIKSKGVLSRVIMLTARGEVRDRVAGLKAGADDYLTKPFALEELLARIDALGRRGGSAKDAAILDIGNIVMDLDRRKVSQAGEPVELSPREFEVFQILMQEPGRTFSRDEICERIWEREHEYDTRTVEIFIMRLRKKLKVDDQPSIIKTVRGVGYCIDEEQ
jgi:DNA-binding response OmpR family regulator